MAEDRARIALMQGTLAPLTRRGGSGRRLVVFVSGHALGEPPEIRLWLAASVINNTMLVQIAILGWLFLSEAPSLIRLVGIAVVTIGITGSQRYSLALRRNSSG